MLQLFVLNNIPKLLIIFCLTLFILRLAFPNFSHASAIDDQISQITKQISDLEKAIAPLKKESGDISQKIKNAKAQITNTEKEIISVNTSLVDQESSLEVQKVLLGERVRRYYINIKRFNPLLIFLSNTQSSSLIKQYAWYQSIINQDRNLIVSYNQNITQLSSNKALLQTQKVKLASIKSTLETRFGFLSGEIKKAEDYKAELSKKQQDLIAEKTAMFNTSVGDVSSSDDPASRADYNPGFSPAFAAFSFGAPHRKGMSQFGAFGRSKNGQNYETILKTYYGDIKLEKIDTSGSIKTTVGSLPFEDDYLVGIAEMPISWADQGGYEAMKAQAIAARTYALNSTSNRAGTICVTEACQVYKSSRASNPGRWRDAVNDTRGIVIKSNSTGQIFSTMYASTSGGAQYGYSSNGHNTPQIWDTTCGSQSCWPGDAYEKKAGSSWYYKGWYKTRSNISAGRSHPWLNNDEFSDIVNAAIYFSKTHDSSHLSQVQNCLGSCDSNAWSRDELKRQMDSHGGAVTSVNSVNVDYSTGGYTQNVRLSTNRGDFTISGDEFKQIFILRAPGAIAIKSGLFNIEKK